MNRDWGVPLTQSAIMLVADAPQQGLPGAAVGYTISEGDDENVVLIASTSSEALLAENLLSGAPGAKNDAIRQRGIKVLHIGLQESAFFNAGSSGTVIVRIKDASGNVVSEGSHFAYIRWLQRHWHPKHPSCRFQPPIFPQNLARAGAAPC